MRRTSSLTRRPVSYTHLDVYKRQDPDHKVHRLLDFSDHPRDIADPWYTGNFDVTYDDIVEGCEALLAYLEKKGEIRIP